MNIKYHYLIMSQKDLLQNQVIEEILREKSTYYISQNKTLDFWLLISPKFITELGLDVKIKSTNFFQSLSELEQKKESYCCLISCNIPFMTWVKLRLGYFEELNVTQSSSTYKYKSDGICGELLIGDESKRNYLFSEINKINSEILINKFKTAIDVLC